MKIEIGKDFPQYFKPSYPFLIALILCGIIVMKIFNIVLNLEFENIGATGFIAGLCAWLILLIGWGIKAVKTKRNK